MAARLRTTLPKLRTTFSGHHDGAMTKDSAALSAPFWNAIVLDLGDGRTDSVKGLHNTTLSPITGSICSSNQECRACTPIEDAEGIDCGDPYHTPAYSPLSIPAIDPSQQYSHFPSVNNRTRTITLDRSKRSDSPRRTTTSSSGVIHLTPSLPRGSSHPNNDQSHLPKSPLSGLVSPISDPFVVPLKSHASIPIVHEPDKKLGVAGKVGMRGPPMRSRLPGWMSAPAIERKVFLDAKWRTFKMAGMRTAPMESSMRDSRARPPL